MGCGGSKRLYPEGEGIPEKLRPLLRRRYEQIMKRRGIHKPPNATSTLSKKQLLDENHVADDDNDVEESDRAINGDADSDVNESDHKINGDEEEDSCVRRDDEGQKANGITIKEDEESSPLLNAIDPLDSSAVISEEPRIEEGKLSEEDDAAVEDEEESSPLLSAEAITLLDSLIEEPSSTIEEVSKTDTTIRQEESVFLSSNEYYSSDTTEDESDNEEESTFFFSRGRGSPSFRVYLPSEDEDDDEFVESSDNAHKDTSDTSDVEIVHYCTDESCLVAEKIVEVNEGVTGGTTKKRWGKTMKLKKVFPLGKTNKVRKLLNGSSCYYSSCSGCNTVPPTTRVAT